MPCLKEALFFIPEAAALPVSEISAVRQIRQAARRGSHPESESRDFVTGLCVG